MGFFLLHTSGSLINWGEMIQLVQPDFVSLQHGKSVSLCGSPSGPSGRPQGPPPPVGSPGMPPDAVMESALSGRLSTLAHPAVSIFLSVPWNLIFLSCAPGGRSPISGPLSSWVGTGMLAHCQNCEMVTPGHKLL